MDDMNNESIETESGGAIQAPESNSTETDATDKGFNFEQFFSENQDGIKKALSAIIEGSPEYSVKTDNELQDQIQKLAEKERQLDRRLLENETLKLLSETSLPATLMDIVIGADLETTAQNIKAIKEVFYQMVSIEVNNRLRGTVPPASASAPRSDTSTRNAIQNIIRR
jgi:hypothetical protein